MCALQWTQIPNYSALILRKTFADLNKAGALIPRSKEWLMGTDAVWSAQDKRWTFPNGSTLSFGHMENEDDKYNYQGAELQFIGFDEVTHFTESQYRYMFSRLRKPKESPIPLKIRSTGNPDGKGFEWVRRRFVANPHPDRPFVKSKLEDNPHLDIDDYERALDVLDPITRAKLRDGNWDIRAEGEFFQTSKIQIIDRLPDMTYVKQVRRWDLASTPEPKAGSSDDPDYTVGVKCAIIDGQLYILDMVRGRWDASGVEAVMIETAFMDDIQVEIVMEEEGGSSGKMVTEHLRKALAGYAFQGKRSTGNKEVRARPLASWLNQGKVKMLSGSWNEDLLDELALFPTGNHDDIVDALSLGFLDLTNYGVVTDFYYNHGISLDQDIEFN